MKIRKLEIENFRGITDKRTLDFTDKQGKALSAIIYGDNGTGKSSIIDAIEYNLQCKLYRYIIYENQYSPTILNFSKLNDTVSTKVEFDNNTSNLRSLSKWDDGIYHSSVDEMHQDFDKVSFFIRRNDINMFTLTEVSQRLIFLSQFIYDNNGIFNRLARDPETKYLAIHTERNKEEKEKIIDELAKLTGNSKELISQYSLFMEETYNAIFVPFGEERYHRIPIEKEKFSRIKELSVKLRELEREILFFQEYNKRLEEGPGEGFEEVVMPFIYKASDFLNDSFIKISGVDYVKRVLFVSDTLNPYSVHLMLELKNGEYTECHHILSEANYDLLILLLYLSLIRTGVEKGQSKVLVLDDVLQSVDSKLRANFISYILKELKDWQIIITCHDRLWLSQLKYLFHLENHQFAKFSISNWNFNDGPVIEKVSPLKYDDTLEKAIESNNIKIIASMAGLFLEMICQHLSVSLQVAVPRRPDDKYTIGDLWNPLMKQLKKTNLKELVEQIDSKKIVRNMLSCHYNEWAIAMSDSEILEFANSVLELYKKTFCKECGSWISRSNADKIIAECKCRRIQY